MKYEVYHSINPTFFCDGSRKYPEDYKKVAIVECNDLEDVFRLTNHIDEDWTTNPEIIETFGDRFRSTSVGDVVVDANGVVNRCDMIGWVVIPPKIIEGVTI